MIVAVVIIGLIAGAKYVLSLDRPQVAVTYHVCGRCNGREFSPAVWPLHCRSHELDDAADSVRVRNTTSMLLAKARELEDCR